MFVGMSPHPVNTKGLWTSPLAPLVLYASSSQHLRKYSISWTNASCHMFRTHDRTEHSRRQKPTQRQRDLEFTDADRYANLSIASDAVEDPDNTTTYRSQKSITKPEVVSDGSRASTGTSTWPSSASAGIGFADRSQLVVEKKKLERCQEVLLRAFRISTEEDTEDLVCTISCTLSATRCLHTSEMRDAIAMHAYAQRSERYWIDHSTADFHAWLMKFGALFTINDEACVAFGMAEMAHFLRSFRIRGIDSSHRTVAMICLAFRELDNLRRVKGMPSPFSSYAACNWQHHHRIAAKSSISLRYERLARKRSGSRDRRSTACSPRRRNSLSLDRMQVRLHKLEVEDEAEDWILIDNR